MKGIVNCEASTSLSRSQQSIRLVDRRTDFSFGSIDELSNGDKVYCRWYSQNDFRDHTAQTEMSSVGTGLQATDVEVWKYDEQKTIM